MTIKIEKMRDWWLGLLVASIAFVVYANSLGNGFVTDDPSVILHNPALQGTPLSLFSTIDTISDTQLLPFYRPVTYLTFYAEGKLHGFNPIFMHLANILLHAANAFLVHRLARTLFEDQWPALLAGILFAIHPIHSESVNFLSGGRNTMLACLFALLAYTCHHKAAVQNRLFLAFIGAVSYFCGMLSKESALMILPVIMLQELTIYRQEKSPVIHMHMVRLLPYASVALCYLYLRWLTLSKLGIQSGIIPGFGAQKLHELYIFPSFSERIIDNVYIIPKYFLSLVWPVALSPRYTIPHDLHILALPLIVGWIIIIGVIIWLLRNGGSPATRFGLIWFVAFWIPVSGIFPMSSIQMADRYMYLPAIGLWILLASQTSRLWKMDNTAIKYVWLSVVILFLVMATLTVKRNLEWKDEISLFTKLVEQYPENPNGYYHLGSALLKRKGPDDLEAAQRNLEMVIALDPATQSVQTPLGHIRLERGDYEGALRYYSEAIGKFPLDREARINRGIVYEKLGRYKEALAEYKYYLTMSNYNQLTGSQEYASERIRDLSQ